jgi:hypothetical protein
VSWRFRKSFQVIPGVKLNLTARGLSATVGGSPVSINFGSRGTYANVRLPGTGIWDRVRLDAPSKATSGGGRLPAPTPTPPIPDAIPIRSASTEMLTSEGFDSLRVRYWPTRTKSAVILKRLSVTPKESWTVQP